jgi:hypothetical protein
MEWTTDISIIPDNGGHFWVYSQTITDGEITNIRGPEISFLKRDYYDDELTGIDGLKLGTDDNDFYRVNKTGHLIKKAIDVPREFSLTFDSPEEKKKKMADRVDRIFITWIKPIHEPIFSKDNSIIDPYDVVHQKGVLSIEKAFSTGGHYCDVGVQIAIDGRIWLCVNGQAYIRFKPSKQTPFENGEVVELPYLEEPRTQVIRKYNTNYGDHRICLCGHTYDRHFDSYANMEAVGCKYCQCYDFKEDPNSNNCIKK